MVILRGRQPCGARFEHRFLHGHLGGLLLFYRVYSRAGTVYGCGKPIYLCGVVCGRAGHCRGRCWLFGLHCYFKRRLGATAPKPLTDIAPPVFAENFLANRLICVMIMDVRRRASIFCFPLLPEITKPAFPPRTPEKASIFASVAQVDRAFGSDNSDRQLGAAEKPHNKAIFRHRIIRFCSSLTTI